MPPVREPITTNVSAQTKRRRARQVALANAASIIGRQVAAAVNPLQHNVRTNIAPAIQLGLSVGQGVGSHYFPQHTIPADVTYEDAVKAYLTYLQKTKSQPEFRLPRRPQPTLVPPPLKDLSPEQASAYIQHILHPTPDMSGTPENRAFETVFGISPHDSQGGLGITNPTTLGVTAASLAAAPLAEGLARFAPKLAEGAASAVRGSRVGDDLSGYLATRRPPIEPYRMPPYGAEARRLDEALAKSTFGQRFAARQASKPHIGIGPLKTPAGLVAQAAAGTGIGGAFAADPILSAVVGSQTPVQNVAQGVGYEIPRYAIDNPAATAKSLRDSLFAAPAAIADSVLHPTTTGKALVEDFIRRWGPIYRGDFQQGREQAKEYGATPFLFDALIAGAPLGRAAGEGARLGALGPAVRDFAEAERPALRSVPGVVAEKQRVSSNLFTVAAQRLLDKMREGRTSARRTAGDYLAAGTRKGEVNPLRAGRVGRIAAAELKGRYRHAMLDTQKPEIRDAILKGADKLNDDEQLGLPEAIGLGAHTPEAGRQAALARVANIYETRHAQAQDRAEVLADRYIEDHADPDHPEIPTTPEEHAALVEQFMPEAEKETAPPGAWDELGRLEYISEHADQVFTPALAEYAQERTGQAERLAELDPGVAGDQALIRSRAQQGEVLGVSRETPEGVPPEEHAADYAGRVDQAAQEAGLGKAGYFPSSIPRESPDFSSYAVGGTRAVADPHRYSGALFDRGVQDSRVHALAQGYARNIKRSYNWNLVSDTFERFTFPWARNKSVPELLELMRKRGISEGSVRFYSPRRFREGQNTDYAVAGKTEDIGAEGIQGAISGASLSPREVRGLMLHTNPEDFGQAQWSLVPAKIHDEVFASTRDSTLSRVVTIATQKQSRYLLASLNLPWLQFQVISNGALTALGAGVGPLDIVKSIQWWRGLSNSEKEAIRPYLGTASGYGSGSDVAYLGAAANNRLVNSWRALKQTTGGKRIWGHELREANPLDLMFAADHAQNGLFRTAVFYSKLKKQAYKEMGAGMGRIGEIQNRINHFLDLGPKEQMSGLLRETKNIEAHAKEVDTWLGNWTTFTSAERKFLRSNVLFYSFLRYSTRLAFYTMPIRHPVMTGILGNLGRLEANEVRDILGGDELPYGLGRIYLDGGESKVDFSRANPLLSALSQAAFGSGIEGKAGGFIGLFPPLYGAIANQLAQRDIFLGKQWRIEGENQPRNYLGIGFEDRLRIMGRSVLSMFYPYRVAEQAAFGGRPTGADSLAWDPRFTQYQDPTIVGQIRRDYADQQQGIPSFLYHQLFPFAPQPSHDVQIAESIRAATKAEKESLGITNTPNASDDPTSGFWGPSSGSSTTRDNFWGP